MFLISRRRATVAAGLVLAVGTLLGDGRPSPSVTAAPPGSGAVVALINASAPRDNLFSAQFCGGVLVAPSLVLTAAHCLGRSVRTFDVVVGADNLCRTAPVLGERRHVVAVVRHPAAADGTAVDAAVLVLQAPVRAAPVGLPLSTDASFPKGVALGWGRNGVGGVMPCRLQSVPLMFVGADRCSQAQRRLHVTPATGWQLCATPTSMAARNTCTGDSGSPVLSVDPPATVLGIVSWGPTCALHDVGVYTDTAPLASWIRMLRTAGALRLDE